MTVNIGVFCGASVGSNPAFTAEAFKFGEQLALHGFGLVYGAGGKGMMGAVSDGALSRNGKVHGIIPRDMFEREWARTDLTQLSTVSDIHERKRRMYKESSVIVTLAGGFGTLDEFFESVTWSQLGYHDTSKPTYLLNTNGFYDDLRNMLDKIADYDFARTEDRELITVVDTIDDLMYELANCT